MKKSKVVINKSFYLGDLKKDILFFNSMNLIKENVVVYGIDSYGRCYTKKDNDIEIQNIDIKKEYMKVSARIRNNFEFFLDICKKTDYPNVTNEKIKIFCKGLIDIINNEQGKYATLELLKDLIEQFINYNDLIFLKDNEERIIMESFYSLRQQRCIVFRDSMHIFDKELVDEQKMNDEYMALNDGNKLENYKFLDSKAEVNIQISDVIIYLIAKYLKFLTHYPNENVENILKSLNKIGRENLTMLIQIINKSNEENTFFLETINSQRINLRRNLIKQHIENILNI